MEKQSSTFQFGVPLDQASVYFFLCLCAAIALVFLFCKKKFDEPSVEANEDDFAYQLLPRYLATKQEYSRGFLIYFGSMAFTVFMLSLVGPKPLSAFGVDIPPQLGNAVVPLFVALVLVGILPNVPVLQEIEKWIRKYAHERAFIPGAARAAAEKLSAADFDFESYDNDDVLQRPEMRGVARADFHKPRRSLEHSWARLSCLVYELKWRRMAGTIESLDSELLRKYAADLDSIEDKRNALEADVAHYRETPTSGDGLHRTMRTILYKLYVLLGCAIRSKPQPQSSMQQALRKFGFVLPPTPTPPENRDLMIVGLTVMAASVLVVCFVALVLGRLGLWTVSADFPSVGYQPFSIAASTVFAHSIAIFVAELIRTRRIAKGCWFNQNGAVAHATGANYIRVALACGVAGYAAFVLWGLVFGSAGVDLFKEAAPYALLPAATGGFFACHLDNAELNSRPSRFIEAVEQAAVTGFCGLIASTAALVLAIDAPVHALDEILLMTAVGATIGGSFGWYLPQAAATLRYDPLAAARNERLRTLEAAALRQFKDPAKARRWIEHPLPALRDLSPKLAAVELETYEHAISLLETPQPAAVH
jgi:hypothetical protein